MKLFAFAASHRRESTNRKLVRYASEMARKRGAEVMGAEYGEFDMPIYDQETYSEHALPQALKRFVSYLEQADGIILASPEYNWSFPGSLKNIIDWASVLAPNPFAGKTALLLSASPPLRAPACLRAGRDEEMVFPPVELRNAIRRLREARGGVKEGRQVDMGRQSALGRSYVPLMASRRHPVQNIDPPLPHCFAALPWREGASPAGAIVPRPAS